MEREMCLRSLVAEMNDLGPEMGSLVIYNT